MGAAHAQVLSVMEETIGDTTNLGVVGREAATTVLLWSRLQVNPGSKVTTGWSCRAGVGLAQPSCE